MSPDRDDYLWDGGGAVDPEVARLEALLGGLGHRGAPPHLPGRSSPRRAIAIAGGLGALAAAIAIWFATRPATPCGGDAGFRFAAIAGEARCGDAALAQGTLPVGGWLETSRDGAAALTIADIGEVRIGADSRVGLVATGPAQHRLSLLRGTMHAVVTAPPRLFIVDTPAATAIDLGCEYDLTVDPEGTGTLAVRRGTVELAARDRIAVVPAGTIARTRTAHGPGTPARRDAPPALVAALARLDDATAPAATEAALDEVLALAEAPDAITLWNLLAIPAARARVFAYLDAIAPAPRGVTRDAILAGDAPARLAWRRDLERRIWQLPMTLFDDLR